VRERRVAGVTGGGTPHDASAVTFGAIVHDTRSATVLVWSVVVGGLVVRPGWSVRFDGVGLGRVDS
jgi:hypothetical protein